MDKQQELTLNWVVKEQGVLREFLKQQQISKAALTDIKYNGGIIEVNGKEVNVRTILEIGDVVQVTFPPEAPSKTLLAEELPLNIHYEDDYVLVVEKPPNMNTIPSREHPRGSLANGIIAYLHKLGLSTTVHIVTRLDRDTSGLVLIAKHRHIHHLLSEQQKQQQIKRTYQAVVEGIVEAEHGRIEEPIGRKKTSIIEREVRSDGQYACTLYNVLTRFKNHTHIQVNLLTGRTHQIRVHLAYIGHILAGDSLYGGSREKIKRHALHCSKVEFIHPILLEPISIEIPLSKDMEELLYK